MINLGECVWECDSPSHGASPGRADSTLKPWMQPADATQIQDFSGNKVTSNCQCPDGIQTPGLGHLRGFMHSGDRKTPELANSGALENLALG